MPACSRCGAESGPDARFCASCGLPLARTVVDAASVDRRTVTIVFSDLAGSTDMGERLDPESVSHVMGRYSEEMKWACERHGGTVEKFIGDAVMAVFGLPIAHEDDALRAVKAAQDMRETLARLNEEFAKRWGVTLNVRTGVNTGEVVTRDHAQGHAFVTGDTVNTAARLEQAAPPGEILLGEETYRLVRHGVEAEPTGPLTLKGKAMGVPAFRLSEVREATEGIARRLDSPLVGRAAELAELRELVRHAAAEGSFSMATVLGSAGVGKSRLARELVTGLGEDVEALRGRCLPYGEGITFWPMAEVVKQLAGIREEDSPAEAEQMIRALLPADEHFEVAVRAIAAAIGLSQAAVDNDQVFWAFRRLLETVAGERPLLVVFDDIHWGEQTFLDLLDYIAESPPAAGLVVLCLTRPEMREIRPSLAVQSEVVRAIALQPLDPEQIKELIRNSLGELDLGEALIERITQSGGGNPLFVEQMLRMLVDDGVLRIEDGRWRAVGELSAIKVPGSIEALLAARLDRLTPEEQMVMERASVIGEEFWSGAVEELLPDRPGDGLGTLLSRLMQKELVVEGGQPFAGEQTFKFGHILIRDVSYGRLLKGSRSELHESFAGWLEQRVGERVVEYEEILGYHFEQAYRYRDELGPLDDKGRELAALAVMRLSSAGVRAHTRGDMPGTVKLLERAFELPQQDARNLEPMLDLGVALLEVGQLRRAQGVLVDLRGLASTTGRRALAARALVELLNFRLWTTTESALEEVPELVDRTLPVFEEVEDDVGMARALSTLADVQSLTGRSRAMSQTLERALVHARRAGEEQTQTRILAGLAGALHAGPAHADEGIARLEELLGELKAGPVTRAVVEAWAVAGLEAMRGNAEEARSICVRAKCIFEEFGQVNRLADLGLASARVEMLAGDWDRAEAGLRETYETLDAMGEKIVLSTVSAELAECLFAQHRFDEAESFADRSAELAAEDDMEAQILWRATKARVLAHNGDVVRAERVASDAVELALQSDSSNQQGAALVALADVLLAAGRSGEAVQIVERAVEVFESKGNFVYAQRAAELGGVARPARDGRSGGRITGEKSPLEEYSAAAREVNTE